MSTRFLLTKFPTGNAAPVGWRGSRASKRCLWIVKAQHRSIKPSWTRKDGIIFHRGHLRIETVATRTSHCPGGSRPVRWLNQERRCGAASGFFLKSSSTRQTHRCLFLFLYVRPCVGCLWASDRWKCAESFLNRHETDKSRLIHNSPGSGTSRLT